MKPSAPKNADRPKDSTRHSANSKSKSEHRTGRKLECVHRIGDEPDEGARTARPTGSAQRRFGQEGSQPRARCFISLRLSPEQPTRTKHEDESYHGEQHDLRRAGLIMDVRSRCGDQAVENRSGRSVRPDHDDDEGLDENRLADVRRYRRDRDVTSPRSQPHRADAKTSRTPARP